MSASSRPRNNSLQVGFTIAAPQSRVEAGLCPWDGAKPRHHTLRRRKAAATTRWAPPRAAAAALQTAAETRGLEVTRAPGLGEPD